MSHLDAEAPLTADQVIARGNHILLAHGKSSTVFRKLWNRTLAPGVVDRHVALQHAEGAAVLYNLLQRPTSFYEELRRYSCSLALAMAHGKRAPTFSGVDSSGFSVKEFYRLEHDFNCALPLFIIANAS